MQKSFSSTSLGVRFTLNDSYSKLKSDPNKASVVMLKFSSKKRRFARSTGYKCSLNHWDVSKQRLKTGKSRVNNAYEINSFLNDLEEYTKLKFDELSKANANVDLKYFATIIENRIKGIDELKKECFLIRYAETVLKSKSNIKEVTRRSHNQTINLLNRYEKEVNKRLLTFEDINMSFYRNFTSFLEEEDFCLNSVGKHIKNLKTYMNEALLHNLTQNKIFKSKQFSTPKESTTQIYLDELEIDQLAVKDLSKYPEIDRARDIFMIGYYTGQRVSDYNGLNNKNIKSIKNELYIKINQKKTGNEVLIPITKPIEKIMSKYKGDFPPKMSEPVLRLNLKKAAQKAKLFKQIEVSYTKGGVEVTKSVLQYKLVKTHTARRSFCSNYYAKGKSIQDIMLFSGHKTEREFYNYIRLEKEEKALAIVKNGFFE